MKSHRNRRRVTRTDLEVDIADSAIERKLVRIDNGSPCRWAPRGKLQHVPPCPKKLVALLEPRRVRSQDKHGAMCAISDQPYPRPKVNRPADPISPFRDKNYPLLRCLLYTRSEEHTSELQSLRHLVCR